MIQQYINVLSCTTQHLFIDERFAYPLALAFWAVHKIRTISLISCSSKVGVWPLDEHNAKLLDAVHPRSWATPERPEDFAPWAEALGAYGANMGASF